jgi:hypothetical protein
VYAAPRTVQAKKQDVGESKSDRFVVKGVERKDNEGWFAMKR